MGSLKDEVYEKLDYLSQLTEVVIGPQNEVLAKIPDRIELDFDKLNWSKGTIWGGPGISFAVNQETILSSFAGLERGDAQYIQDIAHHFEFEYSEDFEIDFSNRTMAGTIALVKKVHQVDEKKILEIAVLKAERQLNYFKWPVKRIKEKAATVLNTLEPNKGTEWLQQLEGRAAPRATNAICETLRNVITENKWRVRDANVIVKIGEWIDSYLADEGDTSTGLVNLIKLKMMLDKDRPVYSVEEVQSVKST